MSMGGPNGQWVRARTDRDAKILVAEREMEAERRRKQIQRSRRFRRRVLRTIRTWLRRRG